MKRSRIQILKWRGIPWLAAAVSMAVFGWWMGARLGGPPTGAAAPVAVVPHAPPVGHAASSRVPAEVRGWWIEIERETNPVAQAAAAARLVARLQPGDWPVLLKQLDWFSRDLTRSVLESALVRRWAGHDPRAAASWGLEHSDLLAAVAVGEWVTVDAMAAQEWFESLTPQQRDNGYVQGEFYATLAARDPGACFALILKYSREPGFNLRGAEERIARASPEGALAFADRVADAGLRETFRAAVAREFGYRDPAEGVAWALRQEDVAKLLPVVFQQVRGQPASMIPALAQLPPDQQKHVLDKSWAWWERGDPFSTLEALRSAPETLTAESRQHLITRAMQVMTSHFDIAESVRLLESDWSELAGTWERRVAAEWARREPEAARAWIDRLPPGPVQDKALLAYEEKMKSRAKENSVRDPVETAVKAVIGPNARLPRVAGDGFSRFATRALNSLDSEGRRQVWERTAGLPEEQRSQARANLVAIAAMNQPQETAAWLQGNAGEPPDTQLASRLVANWSLDDPPGAAQWVLGLPAGEAKTWALWNLASQWQRVDAGAARRWAESQPASVRAVAESAFSGRRPGQ